MTIKPQWHAITLIVAHKRRLGACASEAAGPGSLVYQGGWGLAGQRRSEKRQFASVLLGLSPPPAG